MKRHRAVNLLVITVVLIVAAGAVATWAQNKVEDPGSLAGLTAEVRQLRLAIEESAKTQTQTQAMSVYLSAQQSRLIQTSARLDAVRTELGGAVAQTRMFAAQAASAQSELAQTTVAAERAHLTEMVRMFKDQADRAAEHEERIRNRETELLQAFRADEARWMELIARLEQLIKR